MKKSLALKSVIIAGGLILSAEGIAACGTGVHYTTVADSTYCVNQMTGMVEPPQYCQMGSSFYNPGLYDYWVGPTYGHTYHTGVVIQHNYFVSGKTVNPSSASARKAAGLPVSGSVSNGARSTLTTKTVGGSPAKPQNSPSRTNVSGTTTKSTTTTRSTSSFGSSSRSSSFGSSSTSRSSSFGSSGGRK